MNYSSFLMLIRLCRVLLVTFTLSTVTYGATGHHIKLPKICAEPNDVPKCEVKSNGGKLACRKDYKAHYRKEYYQTKVLILCSWSDWYINPEEILKNFPVINKLIIRHGNVTDFLTDFPESRDLEQLILSELAIEELRPGLFSSLVNLKLLDLSSNRLKRIDPGIIAQPSLTRIVLTDNPWDCSSDLKWILDSSIKDKLVNMTGIMCRDDNPGPGKPGKPVYAVVSLIESMEKECPKELCTCTMENIVWNTFGDRNYLRPFIAVDCSHRDLREMPSKLPQNTTKLNLAKNNISDLLPLVHSEIYRNIADIYLDYNEIKSINVLEGSAWLKSFRILSLKGNQLSELPTYALDNAFDKNTNMGQLYLGHNPWKCDCLFTPDFQHLIIKYESLVKDKHDIRCAEKQDDTNSQVEIIKLSISAICQRPRNEINPLDVLSGVFAFLIVLVIGKLIYDYWSFKRTGKLPWIVAKMP